jgi:hypothetical protein
MFKHNKKNIVFKSSKEYTKYFYSFPKSAYNFIPDWFKNDKNYSNGTNDVLSIIKNSNTNPTYKMCVPLTDTMTSGYIVTLPATIVVSNAGDKDNYIPLINWNVTWNICDDQPGSALQNYPVPYGHSNTFFR